MAATTYAALLSLTRSLHQILNLEQLIDPLHKQIIVSLHEKVDFVVTFLEDHSDKYGGTPHLMGDGEIRKAAYEAQDCMDLYLCTVSATNGYDWSSSEANWDKASLDQDLNMALERITFIWESSMEMKNTADTSEDIRPVGYSSPVDPSATVKTTAKDMEVGFDDDFNAIKERLYEDSANLQIIPIVGMGGIGKTTLTRKVYDDSLLARHFDIYAWITMSAEYQRREILLGLLLNFKQSDEEQSGESQSTENSSDFLDCFNISSNELSDKSDAELEKLVYQNLIGRRYLIVIDDIWSTKAWDDLKKIFSDDGSGSRILLTTRISDVAVYAGSSSNLLHQMNFLSEDHSWKLLQERIFGKESCPFQLVKIGKKIARNCGGLPLTIVVVAGLLLSSGNITNQELWENISENISSTEPTIALQCSRILCLSYDKLPLHLKPCFLYITAFPEDMEINVSKLIKLWVAEGFVRPNDQYNCLEDVGERYLEDLVNRSLILVNKREVDGKLEVVGIHDLLREICISKAEEEGFLQHVSSKNNTQNEVVDNPGRRISIHYTQTFQEWPIEDSRLRSVLLFSERNLGLKFSLSCRRLSILDAPEVTWPNFSDVVPTFVNLRYISFALNKTSCPDGFPASISKLPSLQTIIAHIVSNIESFEVPCEIWEMPELRHLIMNVPFHLSYPSKVGGIVHESGLQTLDEVMDFRFTEDVVITLVNLKKLIVIFTALYDNLDDFNLDNLFRLRNLEELHVSVHNLNNTPGIWNYDFPISLIKLTLCGVPLPWENMTIIGSLPNLQVLHMMSIYVTRDSEWTPTEGQFPRLKHFRSSLDNLVKWEVEKEHFPSLESLSLCRARIDEIPCGIGEIDSLQLIELVNCHLSLVLSAEQIQKQQYENGNDTFQVRVTNTMSGRIKNEYPRDWSWIWNWSLNPWSWNYGPQEMGLGEAVMDQETLDFLKYNFQL